MKKQGKNHEKSTFIQIVQNGDRSKASCLDLNVVRLAESMHLSPKGISKYINS